MACGEEKDTGGWNHTTNARDTSRDWNCDDLRLKCKLESKIIEKCFLETLLKVSNSSWLKKLDLNVINQGMSDSFLLDLRRKGLTNETATEPLCKRIQQMSDQHHELGVDSSGHFMSVNPNDSLGEWTFITAGGENENHPFMICTGNKDYYWRWNGSTGIDLINASEMDLRNFDDNQLFYIEFGDNCQFLRCNDPSNSVRYYVTYQPTDGSVVVKQFENEPENGSNACLEILECPDL